MIFEWDDFGANHVISDMCQSKDCRDKLDELHRLNPAFRCTLFAIPGEMTLELLAWCQANQSWVELAVHGFFHTSNYECEKMSYEDFDHYQEMLYPIIEPYFKKIFRAPGWQISDGALKWLQEKGWIVADQSYNDSRRPSYFNAYVNYDGTFKVCPKVGEGYEVEAYHGHTWDVGWNGIYEDFDKVQDLVKNAKEFKFVSELFE